MNPSTSHLVEELTHNYRKLEMEADVVGLDVSIILLVVDDADFQADHGYGRI